VKVRVYVTLKRGILDPQGKAVQQSLETLGFKDVLGVRIGKYLEIDFSGISEEAISREVKDMCEKLLANTVIEEYRFDLDTVSASPGKKGDGG
jgi:phosphoribosylformylglycinamidine synthase PurS subunit